jgi:hypothetical protein
MGSVALPPRPRTDTWPDCSACAWARRRGGGGGSRGHGFRRPRMQAPCHAWPQVQQADRWLCTTGTHDTARTDIFLYEEREAQVQPTNHPHTHHTSPPPIHHIPPQAAQAQHNRPALAARPRLHAAASAPSALAPQFPGGGRGWCRGQQRPRCAACARMLPSIELGVRE